MNRFKTSNKVSLQEFCMFVNIGFGNFIVILTGSGHLVLSALTPETLTARCNLTVEKTQLQEEEEDE